MGRVHRRLRGKVTGLNARVSLALAEPHLLVPVNDPPSEPYSLLPNSGSVQVTGEQNHFDVLAEFARPEGDVLAIATLHEIEEQLARSSRTVVEVRVDGRRVGTLTPKMSGQFLPAIRHMRDRELGTAARAGVQASDVAAEVTLQAARSHELDSGWLNGPAVTVPRLLPEGASHTVPKSFTRSARSASARSTTQVKRTVSPPATSQRKPEPGQAEQEPPSRRSMVWTAVVLAFLGAVLMNLPTVGVVLAIVLWVLAALVLLGSTQAPRRS